MALATDLAVDLGTANTLVYAQGRGIVLNEPSMVSVRVTDGGLIAAGQQAKAMLGRTPPNIAALRPMKDGVIADFDTASRMLQHFIGRVQPRRQLGRWLRPRVVIGVTSGITQVEMRAVRDAAMQAGAREVYLIEEPMAAAIGAGLPIAEPGGHLVVDIGGGTTDVAVISLSGIVYSRSVRVAGDAMDDIVAQYVKKHYNMLIGERRAEEIKIALGSAWPNGHPPRSIAVKGRDLVGGVPKTITIEDHEIRDAIDDCVRVIVEAVRICLERTPAEIAADMVDAGIVVTGGGALLPGIEERLRAETALPVRIAEDPLTCVVRGVGRLLDDFGLLKKVAL